MNPEGSFMYLFMIFFFINIFLLLGLVKQSFYCLVIVQVGQFANCLIEAKNELQHKYVSFLYLLVNLTCICVSILTILQVANSYRSEIIQRKFTITKALLFKADRSSFDRLYQQVCDTSGLWTQKFKAISITATYFYHI